MAKSAQLRFKLRGDRALIELLDSLGKKHAKMAIRKGIRAGGKVLLEATKAVAPKDEGDLKTSIVLRVSKKKRKGEYAMRVQTGESGIGEGDDFYARMLEYGTHKMPARPWMRPAFAMNWGKAARVAQDIIRTEIFGAAKKARGGAAGAEGGGGGGGRGPQGRDERGRFK
jgi:HK97 gp10 family phage protein